MASEVLPEIVELKDAVVLDEDFDNLESADIIPETDKESNKKSDDIIVLEDQVVILDDEPTEQSDIVVLEDQVEVLDDKEEKLEKEVHSPENYSKHTDMYKSFMNTAYSISQIFRNYTYDRISEPTFHHGDDVLSSQRGYELTRSIEGNKLMGSPHNFVDPDEVDRYKMKKIMDKFYRSLVRVHAKMAGIL